MSDPYRPMAVAIPVAAGAAYRIGPMPYFVTGQPTQRAGLDTLPDFGVASVIYLRDPLEEAKGDIPGFNPQESSTLASMAIGYANVSFTPSMTQGDFDLQATTVRWLIKTSPTPLLIHCSSGDRASALWAVHLWADLGLSVDDAIAYGKESGLSNPIFVGFVQNYQVPAVDQP